MIYKLETFDTTTRTWKTTTKFKSTVSRLKQGYELSKTSLCYAYILKGQPVAGTCLAKWVD